MNGRVRVRLLDHGTFQIIGPDGAEVLTIHDMMEDRWHEIRQSIPITYCMGSPKWYVRYHPLRRRRTLLVGIDVNHDGLRHMMSVMGRDR